MQKYLYAICSVVLMLVMAPYTVSAQLININFGLAYPTAQLVGGVGELDWNLIFEDEESDFPDSDTKSGLIDSEGLPTGGSFYWSDLGYGKISVSPFYVDPSESDASYENLMKSYIFSEAGHPVYLAFIDITPGIYDMYIYSQGDTSGQILDMSVLSNGGTIIKKTTNFSRNNATELMLNDNYLLFSEIVVGVDGRIDISFHGKSEASDELSYGVVNGIQLSAVPEPSTMILLGIGSGVLGFGFFRRRITGDKQSAA